MNTSAPNRSQIKMVTKKEHFHDYRHYYLKVSGQVANRLQVGIFLGGLTFAAFAALLAGGSMSLKSMSLDVISQLLATLLLAGASIVLLAGVIGAYGAQQHLGDLAPHTVDLFGTSEAKSFAHEDGNRLIDAYNAYTEGSASIVLGVVLLLLSLVCIGFHINLILGICISIVLAIIAVISPASWSTALKYRKRPKKAKKLEFVEIEVGEDGKSMDQRGA